MAGLLWGTPIATELAMAGRQMRSVVFVALALMTVLSQPTGAQSYRLMVKRLEGKVYQAMVSKVIIETRVCGDLGLAEEPEEAILNWEGRFGNNWLLFTSSKIKCDVLTIR